MRSCGKEEAYVRIDVGREQWEKEMYVTKYMPEADMQNVTEKNKLRQAI